MPALRLSVRTVTVALLVGQTLLVGSVVGALSLRHGDRSVDDLAMELTDAVATQIDVHIAHVLQEPALLNEFNADALLAYDVDVLGETEPMEQIFFRHLQHFPVSLTYIGTARGDYIGARRIRDGEFTISLVNEGTEWRNARYATTADGERTERLLLSQSTYDPRKRPWYQPTIDAGAPAWTDIYADYTSGVLGITASRPYRDRDGALQGVLATDLLLDDLGAFLEQLSIGEHGIAYLVDADGLLVSTSTGTPVFSGPRGEVERLTPAASDHPLIRASASALASHPGEEIVRARLGAEEHFIGADPYTDDMGLDWTIVVVIPRADFTAHIDANLRATVLACLLAMALAALLGGLAAGRLTRALGAVSVEMARVGRLHLDAPPRPPSALTEVAVIDDAMLQMKAGLKSFQRYVPVELVRQLLEERTEAVLGGEPMELTIVFSDIADFTPMTERIAPQTMVTALGAYLEGMNQAIGEADGTVCQYLGDGILALWGAPVKQADHAVRACRGALAMAARSRAMAAKAEASGAPVLHTRIGVNSGDVIVGNIGAPERFNYCAVGDPVNTASRIEGLNKIYGTQVLIGERTHALIDRAFVTRLVDVVRMKGKARPVRVYQLVGEASDVDEATREAAQRHDDAFAAYLNRDFAAARAAFEVLDHPAAAVLAKRCASLQAEPPPEDWDGTWVLTTK